MAGFGETLRQARAHKGVTLREAEQATRINRHHLAALEDENFSALPPLIYQRGIVRNYAVYLELDASNMLTRFEEAHGGLAPNSSAGSTPMPPIDMPSHWAPNFAIIAFAVVLSAIVFAWGYSIWVTPSSSDPETTATALSNTPESEEISLATQLPDRPAPPTIAPTQESEPTATTEEASSEVSGRQDAGDNQRAASEPEESAPAHRTGITLAAIEDTTITLTVDGQLVYEGPLPAGQQTDQYVGSTFAFSTSSPEGTNLINSCGDIVPVSDIAESGTLEFAATENSCPAPEQ